MNLEKMISPAVGRIPPSGIRKFFDIVSEMKDAISLGIGEPDFVTPWAIREAGIYSLEKGYTHYTSNWGLAELRQEIAIYQKRKYGLEFDPKTEIIVTVGGSEAIDLALRALTGPGDEVIIPEPCFVSYKPCAVLTGATPVTVSLRKEDGFKLTPELLKSKLTEKTKVLLIGFPSNPTGAIMEKEDLEKIAAVVKDRDIVVISDEIYSELTYKGSHVSIASLPGMKERTIVINGFSKAFAMTGWRMGYVCGPAAVIAAMFKIHQYAVMCSPTTSQHAAIEALRSCDRDVESMITEYNHRRRVIVNAVRKIGLECFEPLGAFYIFPSISCTGMSSEEFCEKLLMEEKVAVIPGTAFGSAGEGHVRCSYAYSIETINEAVARMAKFIGRHKIS